MNESLTAVHALSLNDSVHLHELYCIPSSLIRTKNLELQGLNTKVCYMLHR